MGFFLTKLSSFLLLAWTLFSRTVSPLPTQSQSQSPDASSRVEKMMPYEYGAMGLRNGVALGVDIDQEEQDRPSRNAQVKDPLCSP